MLKRIKRLRLLLFIMIAMLAARAGYIQIAGHDDLAQAAKYQQTIAIEGISNRGIIRDRHGIAITNTEREYLYVIPAKKLDLRGRGALNWLGAVKRSQQGVGSNKLLIYETSTYDTTESNYLRDECGANIIITTRRYSQNQMASSLIGVAGIDGGMAGLELKYDERLSAGTNAADVTYGTGELDAAEVYADGKGKFIYNRGIIKGEGVQDLYTTLDYNLQQHIESEMGNNSGSYGIVVLDVQSGHLLASSSGGNINTVMQGAYAPGSIFKLVVAAAALEYGAEDENGDKITLDSEFYCGGQINADGVYYGCHTGGAIGHGYITLEDAMAQSCNCAFIRLAQLTGYEKIRRMANSMGLGTVVLDCYPGENCGNVTDSSSAAGAGIGNFAIGQGDILVTPIQVAQVTRIIASGGIKSNVKVVRDEHEDSPKRIMSKDTASKLQAMMRHVMVYGSGSDVAASEYSAGKTGSAEVGAGENSTVNGWFTGFFPWDEPKYVVSVFVGNAESGSATALPIFSDVAEYLMKTLD